jgi:hypothetical protein
MLSRHYLMLGTQHLVFELVGWVSTSRGARPHEAPYPMVMGPWVREWGWARDTWVKDRWDKEV